MIFLFAFALIVFTFSTWVFFKTSPKDALLFNLSSLAITLFISTGLFVWAHYRMAATHDSEWWPVVGTIYVIIQWPLSLLAAGLVRRKVLT